MSSSSNSNRIPIKNIYYMLCYVWNRLEEKDTAKVSQDEEKDIYNLLARILISRLQLLIKRGFYKEYVGKQENTSTIRGRINFPESLNELTFKQAKMYCEFDELSHDILHNQIIKTTLSNLLNYPAIDKKIQEEIQITYPYFQRIQGIRLTNRIFNQVRIHRTNRQYGFLIDICKFLFESLLITENEESTQKFTDFNKNTLEMAYLFEDFVHNFYKLELRNSKVSSEHIYWDATGDDLSYLPRMETDISIETKGKKIIMDTKFYKETLSKNVNSKKLISSNLYQVFAYINNLKSDYDEKTPMTEQGVFDDIDVAMMVHPFGETTESGPMLAIDAIQFAFTGKSSHAAASPEEGINALDSVIQLFNGINAIREHVPSDVKMHGVISEGGQAANIVPDYAVAQYYFRSNSRDTLDHVVAKAKNIAEGAALMTGATVEISNYELSYDNLIVNQTLSDQFTKNMEDISQQPVYPPREASGSADIGDVSQVVPAIHPMVGLNDASLVLHTTEVADKTMTKDGDNALKYGLLSLAQTGYDVITNPDLLTNIKNEFQNHNK